MTSLLTRVQLAVFLVVTLVAGGYGAITYFHVGDLLTPPYEVRAQFATAGGIYPRADVELLGTRVGTVREVLPGPGRSTTVVMALDHGSDVPRDVRATIGSKSAIGEQFVELAPQSAGGPWLHDGDRIAQDRTRSPIDVAVLLRDLDSLAGSLPVDDLSTVLTELSTALDGAGPALGSIIDNTDRLSRVSLANVDELTSLIDRASTVLGTQVDKGPETEQYLAALGDLSTELHRVDGSFADLFVNGAAAGKQISAFLADNEQALPVVLDRLVTLTTIGTERIPAIRKTLAVFPWVLELGATGIRHCSNYDPKTGTPIESSCRYDADGNPIYAAYLAMQLPELPGENPYFPCTQGYQGTKKFQPNGIPVDGKGARQGDDSAPNFGVGCTAAATDPSTPNVRGAQNVTPAGAASGRSAPAWSPAWSMVVDDGAPPEGRDGLAWLLNNQLS